MKKYLILLTSVIAIGQNTSHQMAEGLITSTDLFNTSMVENVACFRIPAIITAPNGDLIAAIDERVPSCADLRGSDDINIVIRRSNDHGETWSNIETVVDFPLGLSASDPSLIVDRVIGEIFMFYNYMDYENERDIYYLHVVSSLDNGKTWSEPKDITSQVSKPEWHTDFKFITSGRGIQTRSGKLLHTIVNLKNGLHVFGSDDHGKSWYLIDTPITPGDESKIIELEDGRWMINSRVNRAGKRYSHISRDEGKTWVSKAEDELIDPGCNGSIIRYTFTKDGYKKNRLLFSNAKMEKGRMNMTVRVSYDEGNTWTEGKTIYPGGSAYSSLTKLKNGDIGLFFEKDDYTKNEFVSFSLHWLTDGKDKYQKPKKRTYSDHYYNRKSLFESQPNKENEIIFLGNSITEGGNWKKLFSNINAVNRGISGDVTDGIINRLDEVVSSKPSKIFLLIGTNDLARGRSVSYVVEHSRKIIEQIKMDSPQSKLFVQSVLPINPNIGDNFSGHKSKKKEILAVNKALKKMATELNFIYVDIHKPFRNYRGYLKPAFSHDGLHLNDAGYNHWKSVIHDLVMGN